MNDTISIATCLDAKTGNTLWQGRLGEARHKGLSTSPIVVGGRVFFTNDDGGPPPAGDRALGGSGYEAVSR